LPRRPHQLCPQKSFVGAPNLLTAERRVTVTGVERVFARGEWRRLATHCRSAAGTVSATVLAICSVLGAANAAIIIRNTG
jgi:hypothetical protein